MGKSRGLQLVFNRQRALDGIVTKAFGNDCSRNEIEGGYLSHGLRFWWLCIAPASTNNSVGFLTMHTYLERNHSYHIDF
jgi:hypothetical protein